MYFCFILLHCYCAIFRPSLLASVAGKKAFEFGSAKPCSTPKASLQAFPKIEIRLANAVGIRHHPDQ